MVYVVSLLVKVDRKVDMAYTILVMSCDKNKDLWKPFYLCMEKYWKDHPEIIYCTETTENPYYKTICKNYDINKWTRRVYECVKEINTKHILLMVDDLFIRDYVDNDFIWLLKDYVKDNYASLNFEFCFDDKDITFSKYMLVRNSFGKFKLSCMCQMWQKRAMLKLFDCDKDPWKFEKDNNALNYQFLISKNGDFINWGKRKDTWIWGVVKGKWTHECKEFFDKEGINDINYEERGFYD